MAGSKRIRLFNTEDFGVDLEYNKDFVIIHLPWIDNFNTKVFKDMLIALEDYSDLFKTLGKEKMYAAVDTNNTKIKRLLNKLGFTRVGLNKDLDIYEKEN